jgi:hypothetical protein
MTTILLPRLAAAALLALGLAGCVGYEPAPYYAPAPAYYAPAPAYYAPAPAYYYGPAPGPSLSFEFRGGDRGGHREHWR